MANHPHTVTAVHQDPIQAHSYGVGAHLLSLSPPPTAGPASEVNDDESDDRSCQCTKASLTTVTRMLPAGTLDRALQISWHKILERRANIAMSSQEPSQVYTNLDSPMRLERHLQERLPKNYNSCPELARGMLASER